MNQKISRLIIRTLIIFVLIFVFVLAIIFNVLFEIPTFETLTLIFAVYVFVSQSKQTQEQMIISINKNTFDTRINHFNLFSDFYDSCVNEIEVEIERRTKIHNEMYEKYRKKTHKEMNEKHREDNEFDKKTKGLTNEINFLKMLKDEHLKINKTNFYYHFFINESGNIESKFNADYLNELISEIRKYVLFSSSSYKSIINGKTKSYIEYKKVSDKINKDIESKVYNFFDKDIKTDIYETKFLIQKSQYPLQENRYIILPIKWTIRLHIINKLLKIDPLIYRQTQKSVDLTILEQSDRFVYNIKNDKAIKDNFKTLSKMESVFTYGSSS